MPATSSLTSLPKTQEPCQLRGDRTSGSSPVTRELPARYHKHRSPIDPVLRTHRGFSGTRPISTAGPPAMTAREVPLRVAAACVRRKCLPGLGNKAVQVVDDLAFTQRHLAGEPLLSPNQSADGIGETEPALFQPENSDIG